MEGDFTPAQLRTLAVLVSEPDVWRTRQELATQMGLSAATTRIHLIALEAGELVERRDRMTMRLGRNAVGWPHEWRATKVGVKRMADPVQLQRRGKLVNGIRVWAAAL